jgi:hypothetical protein
MDQKNRGEQEQKNREPAEGSRDTAVRNQGVDRGERGGISNRGVNRTTEQEDLPGRGSGREPSR